MKRKTQNAIFPDGLLYMGNGEFGTPLNPKGFNVLDVIGKTKSQMVYQIILTCLYLPGTVYPCKMLVSELKIDKLIAAECSKNNYQDC